MSTRDELIRAAAELFARDGDPSLRDIAREAGVKNHGLVRHYFGDKAGIRSAALTYLAEALFARLDLPKDADLGTRLARIVDVVEQDQRHTRALAFGLLKDDLPEGLQDAFPVVRSVLEGLDEDARRRLRPALAEALALGLGIQLFGPFVARATGLAEEALDALRDGAMARVTATLEAAGKA
ncbi:MAG: TetR/AcrR family transcriptional regulator [Myxococcota bacterium]